MPTQLWLAMVSFCLLPLTVFAGPVNSPEGYPSVHMNSQGDHIRAGDLKAIVEWQGRSSALPWALSDNAQARFTTAILERTSHAESPSAIACASKNGALYFAQTSRAHPGGMWKEIPELKGRTFKSKEILCSLKEGGEYAILLAQDKKLLLSGNREVEINSLGETPELLSVGNFFLVIGSAGQIHWITPEGVSLTLQSPFRSHTELTRFSAQSNLIVQADDSGVAQYSVTLPQMSQEPPRVGAAVKLTVAPCDEQQACGVSLARDGSWVVSGAWGTYLGVGSQFRRLTLANLSRESGGVAFAHQGNGQAFLYLGNDDGDRGTLPEIKVTENSEFNKQFSLQIESSNKETRWIVWSKKTSDAALNAPKTQALFPYYDRSKNGQYIRAGDTFVFKGQLPDVIPSHWIAWEKEVFFEAPTSPFLSATAPFAASVPWWIKALERDKAWALANSKGLVPLEVTVGIIDSGAQADHPVLAQSFALKSAEIANNGLDDDDNGYVDDTYGYDFVDEDAHPQDEFWHGTHVAGLISSHIKEGTSFQNYTVATNAKLKIARALNRQGKSNSIDLSRAIRYATDEGAEILNCSWGGGPETQSLRDAFEYARVHKVLVFSSAGNSSINTDLYPEVPKFFPGVISVGALNPNGGLASFSNFGKTSVHWMLPGEKIMGPILQSQMLEKSGTSMAAPMAASSAAWILGLLKARFPQEDPGKLREMSKNILCQSALKAGVENRSVCGKINVARATEQVFQSEP
jgi:hypothetical protein